MGSPEQRLRDLGIVLPTRFSSGQGLLPLVQDGRTIYVSGHGPEDGNGNLLFVGRVGAELTLEQGYEAARAAGIQILGTLRDHLGSLDEVDRILKVLGFVNSANNFHEQPKVMHGFSDLMVEVFGNRGQHARSAIGTSNLPRNQPVEIEMIARAR